MTRRLTNVSRVAVLFSFFTCILGQEFKNTTERYYEAYTVARSVLLHFIQNYESCRSTTMPAQHFLMDDIAAYLFYPAKTTVGYAPNFTSNRKLFANLVGTTAFHNMVAKDLKELRNDYLSKLKFCDEVVMAQEMLKEMHDRVIDENKLK